MKKLFYAIFPLVTLLMLTACEEELPNTMGNIYGIVGDMETGEPIKGASVILSPGNQTTVTGYDGHFEFRNLEAGQYKLQVSANGYNTNSRQITVLAGTNVSGDITMSPIKAVNNISLANNYFNFGGTHTEQILTIGNVGNNGSVSWEITGVDVSWLKITPMSGTIAQGKEVSVKLIVDRNKLSTDEASTTFMVNAAGGSQSVRVNINKPTITGIKGTVKDADYGHFIKDCQVLLSPNNDYKVTGEDGAFKFSGLSTGEYTLRFEKTGYPNKTMTLNISMGEMKEIDVLLKPSTPISSSEEMLDFGDSETEKTFTLINNTDSETSFTITDIPAWLTLNHKEGRLQMSSSLTINAIIDRNKAEEGYYNHKIKISYTGRTKGEILLEIKFVKSSTPNNSSKWDGNIASSFAGGNGTKTNPYKIENGGQLLLMKDYWYLSDTYFKLQNNIDLNNHNWLPFVFKGELDGNDCTISNLRVERSDEFLGLFSTLYGKVTDLTIDNANIKGNTVGAIAGNMIHNAEIKNCHLILKSNSILQGEVYSGGLVGRMGCDKSSDNYINTKIRNCSVISNDAEEYKLIANNGVGGIVGSISFSYYTSGVDFEITNCNVTCNIIGECNIGGIVGDVSVHAFQDKISNCEYKGGLYGEMAVGGIVGYYRGRIDYGYSAYGSDLVISSCKADSEISVEDGYAGGILGCTDESAGCSIISSYSMGTLSCDENNDNIGGITGGCIDKSHNYIRVYMSYSTITSQLSSFKGIGTCRTESECAHIANCENITTYFKELYSNYASNWDFNNEWTWSGTVNGQNKQVKCPRLAWE